MADMQDSTRPTAQSNQVAALSEMLDLPIGDHTLLELDKYINARIRATIMQATQTYGYNMPMKSMRSRNTAFKLYAVKFFNGKIKERRQRLLGALGIDLPTEGYTPPQSDFEAHPKAQTNTHTSKGGLG